VHDVVYYSVDCVDFSVAASDDKFSAVAAFLWLTLQLLSQWENI